MLLELNNHSLSPDCTRANARENDITMLRLCKKYGAKIIMNSDAHWCEAIGNTCYSMPLIEEMDFPRELIVNTSVEEFKSYLKKA